MKPIQSFIKLKLILFTAVLFTFVFHEFGHWLTGEILGNEMGMTLNGSHPIRGYYLQEWHSPFVVFGGPLFTLIQAAVFVLLIIKYKSVYLYPFLFFPFFMRFVTTLVSAVQPQDEAILSSLSGLGKWTVPLIITITLFLLCLWGCRILKIGWKMNLSNAFFSILFAAVVIITDSNIF